MKNKLFLSLALLFSGALSLQAFDNQSTSAAAYSGDYYTIEEVIDGINAGNYEPARGWQEEMNADIRAGYQTGEIIEGDDLVEELENNSDFRQQYLNDLVEARDAIYARYTGEYSDVADENAVDAEYAYVEDSDLDSLLASYNREEVKNLPLQEAISKVLLLDNEDDYVNFINKLIDQNPDYDWTDSNIVSEAAQSLRGTENHFDELIRTALATGANPNSSSLSNDVSETANPVAQVVGLMQGPDQTPYQQPALLALLAFGSNFTDNDIPSDQNIRSILTNFRSAQQALNNNEDPIEVIKQHRATFNNEDMASTLIEYLLVSKQFDKVNQILENAEELNIDLKGINVTTLFKRLLKQGDIETLGSLSKIIAQYELNLDTKYQVVSNFFSNFFEKVRDESFAFQNQDELNNIQEVYEFAKNNGYKKLEKFIDEWLQTAQILSDSVTTEDTAKKILSYL